MRWLAAVLFAFGLLFCVVALVPADSRHATVRAILAAAGIAGFAGALGLLVAGGQPRYWTGMAWLGIAASSALALVSATRLMVLPLTVNVIAIWGLMRGHWTAPSRPPLPDASRHVHPLLYIPVPWVFVLGYLAGVAIQALAPVTIHAQGPRFAVWLVGLVLVVAGSALAGWCLVIFRRARTTTVPLEKSSTVVTWGPYRWSRNPMYVALTLIYLGETAIFAHLWPAVLLLPTLAYVNGVVIPFEEAQLRAAFGEGYSDYAGRVRRWL